jgi:hypothetical protein
MKVSSTSQIMLCMLMCILISLWDLSRRHKGYPFRVHLLNIKKRYWRLNNQVCVYVQQNILNTEFKEDKIFIDEVKTLWREKTTLGQPNPGNPLSKNKASHKALVLTKPIAVVIPLTITRSPSGTLPNQVSYLKGSLIDFTRIRSTH